MSLFLPAHEMNWHRFLKAKKRNKLGHSHLLIGPAHCRTASFAKQMAKDILCLEGGGCANCQSCKLMETLQHPDLNNVVPEKANSSIKIEQIRELHNSIFTSPQLANFRIVILHATERLNANAANALLKILEEPPSTVYFILLAEHLSTVLPTILSRCQHWYFSDREKEQSYLSCLEAYEPTSERGKIIVDLEKIIDELHQLSEGTISACILAERWSNYPFNELIWLLSLLQAEMIRLFYQKDDAATGKKDLRLLVNRFNACQLFAILDNSYQIIDNLYRNININPLLALENLLLKMQQEKNGSFVPNN